MGRNKQLRHPLCHHVAAGLAETWLGSPLEEPNIPQMVLHAAWLLCILGIQVCVLSTSLYHSADAVRCLQESLCLAAPAPTLTALAACTGLTALRLSDASMLSNRITGKHTTPYSLARRPLVSS